MFRYCGVRLKKYILENLYSEIVANSLLYSQKSRLPQNEFMFRQLNEITTGITKFFCVSHVRIVIFICCEPIVELCIGVHNKSLNEYTAVTYYR
jgi:hypothetical protein